MAHKNVTRVGDFFAKKLLSQMVITIDNETAKQFTAAGNYKVANLPENCVVTEAFVVVTKGGTGGVVDVGTTEGGAELIADAVVTAAGVVGALVGKVVTGTGKSVYINLAAAPTARFSIVIQYLELGTKTGSYTLTDNVSA